MNEKELVIKSENNDDLVSKTKTIYNAGFGEIFLKNFLAGISRTLGGIFVYIIFLVVFSGIFLNIVLPKIMPSITNFTNLIKSLGSFSNTSPGSNYSLPENLLPQNLFRQ